MPLLDHFHPPLFPARSWESFHAQWATSLAASLNENFLPKGYFAESEVHVGGRVEMDVGTFEREPASSGAPANQGTVAVAAQPRAWVAPAPAMTMAALYPDSVETLIFTASDKTLVAAVELVSPGNKDRPEARRVFAGKCATYLCDGIGLAIVDVVTRLRANLHNELVALLGQSEAFAMDPASGLYAIAYRPFRNRSAEGVDIWPHGLDVGGALPTIPLAIRADLFVPLDLEATYQEACRRSRLLD